MVFARGSAVDCVDSKDGVYSQSAAFAKKVTCIMRAIPRLVENGLDAARNLHFASSSVGKTRDLRVN